ncbi:MAG TPA: peptidylprolyl isomerase [Ignavibacteriaceae bacterium]|nr:peptidylprolyl isomerase [Ignavibacteriaceae bacterium]
MFFRAVTLFSICLAFLLTSCAPKHSEIVLAKYNSEEVKMKEFEDVYSKNAGGYEQAKDDSLDKLKNFLDLYVNFKMKLKDAKVRGYNQDPSLINELTDYKKKVGVTYLIEKELVEPGIKDLYERRKTELRVSHLMIRPDSTGEEAARNFTQKILDSIKAGASFEEMTAKYSQDTYSKNLGGDIFYVTAGLLPLEFENAMYQTEPGKVYPEVVKTPYGFHIIKVNEKKDRIASVRASHILVDFNNEDGTVDSAAAKSRIDSVLTALKNGESFEKLAKQYSEDPGSKEQGGDLGFFERRMMVKEFDEAAFRLKVNEISDVVKTNYGYHIIKVTDIKKMPTFEEDKENLKKLFKQTRYQKLYDEFVANLKKKFNFKINEDNMKFVMKQSDTLLFSEPNPKLDELKDKELISYNGKSVNYGTIEEKALTLSEFSGRTYSYDSFKSLLDKVGTDLVLEEEAMNLDQRNPEFASLMDDYKNGIYIFKLQDEEVWGKIKLDSAKLVDHYNATKENYKWNDRVSYSEIFSSKDSLINHYYSLLQKGENFDSVAAKYTERAGFRDKAGFYGLTEANANQMSKEAYNLKNKGEYSRPFQVPGGWAIVKLNNKEASRLKTFEEAKAEVSGSFQEAESKRLEQQYIDNLKKIYKPEFNYQELGKAFTTED